MATEIVASALPMQEHWLPQSNLDLILPPSLASSFAIREDWSPIPMENRSCFAITKGWSSARHFHNPDEAKDIDMLQALATQNGTKKRSKLEGFFAYLWGVINAPANDEEDKGGDWQH
eukprot:Gb_17588 [translate_table: standard]